MKVKCLTPKQKQILDFINKYYEKNGYSPSLREIAKNFKKSATTIHQFIKTLENKRYLEKQDKSPRGIKPIIEKVEIPLLGYIAAGEPIEPIENPEEILIPNNIKIDTKYPHYALKVKGGSMIDMGILDKDIVLIKHQMNADNGDVVVAVTENGATLKIFRRKNGKIFLEPRNKNLKNIYPKQLEIRGKYIGLIRNN